MDDISVYQWRGVNVDRSPVHLIDGQLTSAQNAVPDPAGEMGGIRKRPGFTKLSSNAAAGSVLGGIGAPVDLAAVIDQGDAIPAGAVQVTYFWRSTVASGLSLARGAWYSLDGFLTSGNIIEIVDSGS